MPVKQFSIRDLLLLIAFVAIALGWWVDRHNRATVPALSGRYQLQTNEGHAFVLNTASGQVWEKFVSPSGGGTSSGFLEPKTEN